MATRKWIEYAGVELRHVGDGPAYFYRTAHKSLDADGSPRAYHPTKGVGLDDSRNAGYPDGGWRGVLAVDPNDASRPYVQPTGPYAGYFVSKTSLRDRHGSETDPATYVDAQTVPYIVFPGDFYAIAGTGHYGDLVMARTADGRHQSAAIVADGGPAEAPLGEMSLALAAALNPGGDVPNARTGKGAPPGELEYMVFPGSASVPAWPRTVESIRSAAEALLAAAGGWPERT